MPNQPWEENRLEREPRRLVDLGASITSPVGRTVYRLLEHPIERFLSLDALNRLYADMSPVVGDRSYFATALRGLGVEYDLVPEDVAKIPVTGPLVVVANHPFGAVDGLILGDILIQVRPDFRLMANELLQGIPELRPWILPVDAFGGPQSYAHNVSRLRLAIKWLEQGGALGIFPAGAVSHLQLRKGCIADPIWHKTVAGLVRRTGATVITMFFDGHNSMVFQLSGLIHPKLRTALLPSEMLKRSGSCVAVRIGRPIEPHKVSRYPDDRTLTSYLRFKTYMLKWRESPIRPRFAPRISEGTATGGGAATISQAGGRGAAPAFVGASGGTREVSGLSRGREEYSVAARRNRPVARAHFPCSGRGNRPGLRRGPLRQSLSTPVPCGTRPATRWLAATGLERSIRSLETWVADGLYTNTLFKLKPDLLDRLARAGNGAFVRAAGIPGPGDTLGPDLARHRRSTWCAIRPTRCCLAP
jgi:putative hemolysin